MYKRQLKRCAMIASPAEAVSTLVRRPMIPREGMSNSRLIRSPVSVSYTHLDVYKIQALCCERNGRVDYLCRRYLYDFCARSALSQTKIANLVSFFNSNLSVSQCYGYSAGTFITA